MINSVYQLNRICSSFLRSRHPLLLLGNYWVRLSKISHELSKPRPVLPSVSADYTDTRFGISRHPAKPNSIIVLIHFSNNLQIKTLLSEFAKEKTTRTRGSETRQTCTRNDMCNIRCSYWVITSTYVIRYWILIACTDGPFAFFTLSLTYMGC